VRTLEKVFETIIESHPRHTHMGSSQGWEHYRKSPKTDPCKQAANGETIRRSHPRRIQGGKPLKVKMFFTPCWPKNDVFGLSIENSHILDDDLQRK